MLCCGLRLAVYPLRRKPLTSSCLLKPPRRIPSRCFIVNPRVLRTTPIPPHAVGSPTPSKADSVENIKPEAVQKPLDAKSDGAPKTDVLLTEQTVSNKEQRKADWAIMKEMAQYLWPKVRPLGEV